MADKKKENGEQSMFLRILSHELKSPLVSIESLLKVILEGFTGDVDSRTIQFIKKALDKTGDARRIIADLINWEKYSGGKSAAGQDFDLVPLVQKIVNRFHAPAAEKSIALSCRLPAGICIMLSGDRAGLELALSNLLENALKYTPGEGRVSLILTADETAKTCRLLFTDTGCGISKEDQAHLFEPFFRAFSQKASVPGTGLGLSLVKKVINGFGGNITVSSELGAGSTFTITLPYSSVEKIGEPVQPGKRVVIIGGVTAGPKAAARLRRLDENCAITIIEKSEFLSYAGCGIPAYLAGRVSSPKALMSTADNTLRDVHFFESIKNITVLNRTEVLEIDRSRKTALVKNLLTQETHSIFYDILILATGAEAVVPPIPGIRQEGIYSLYRMEDAEMIKREFLKRTASDVFIIGGGLIGVETAESLMACGARVTILEKDTHILKLFDPDIAEKIQEQLFHKGIKVITDVKIENIEREKGRLSLETNRGNFMADIIILSAGVKPNAALGQRAGLELGKDGGLKVDDFLVTSDPSIYAIGDCAESMNLVTREYSHLPLGSISTKMGRIAADNICGRRMKFAGSLGTTMFRVFETTIARTGLEQAVAARSGFTVESVVVSVLDRAYYYPEAQYIILKLLADKKTGKLLGAQGFGRGDVSKCIEVLAVCIARGLTLEEVFELDLGYFPAFNNPIDIAQTACLVLKNKIEGLYRTITLNEFNAGAGQYKTVDVSPITEFMFQSIQGAINVPLENLRREEFPYPPEEAVVLYSKTSSRAYEASRYLSTRGYTNLRVLEGGYVYWKNA